MGLFDIIQKLNKQEVNKLKDDEDTATGFSDERDYNLQDSHDLFMSQDRIVKYRDYELMEEYVPEVASALDIVADDITAIDPDKNACYWIESPFDRTKDLLEEVLSNKLNLNEELWSISRDLVKYGDQFEEIVLDANGVKALKPLHPSTMYRIEDQKGRLVKYEQRPNFYFTSNNMSLYASIPNLNYASGSGSHEAIYDFIPWQVLHSRTRLSNRMLRYGTSFLERARHPANMLRLMEEALALVRLQKAHDRYVYMIDVGNIEPEKALAYVDQIRRRLKKKRFIKSTGSFDSSIDPINPLEDIYIPLRKDDQTKIDKLPGMDVGGRLDDVKYMRQKVISALKIPAAYLGFTEDYTGFVNNTLAMQDKRYIRTIRRYQQLIKSMLKKICDVQLFAMDYPYDEREFEVFMTNSNQLEMQAQAELMAVQVELANNLKDLVPLEYILEKVLHFSPEDVRTIMTKMVDKNTTAPMGESTQRNVMNDLSRKGIDEENLHKLVAKMYRGNANFRSSVDELKMIVGEHKRSVMRESGDRAHFISNFSGLADEIKMSRHL